jgi:hypothetical protein
MEEIKLVACLRPMLQDTCPYAVRGISLPKTRHKDLEAIKNKSIFCRSIPCLYKIEELLRRIWKDAF